jgi:uncharacterized protein (DUF1800 family)
MPLAQQTTVLNEFQAAHLLRRATFGPTPALINQFAGKKPIDAVNQLLAIRSTPPLPIDPNTGTIIGMQVFDDLTDGNNTHYLKRWWIQNMFNSQGQLHEKMMLFWQNHFVSTTGVVGDNRFFYKYVELIRTHALGNFKQFVIAMTKEPIMLRYLNGNANTKTSPNENYGRELQELFTIGRGNYTESDVKAAAKVLTGWRDLGYRDATRTDPIASEFRPTQHDITDKQFSSYYQNTVIKSKTVKSGTTTIADATTGDYELGLLVDMILKQRATALFICRKLYRWFVDADIDANIEQNVIGIMADTFQRKFDIKAVVLELLTSQHFYALPYQGAIVKSPLEFLLGTFRYFNQILPPDAIDAYKLAENFQWKLVDLQQDVLNQPSVFGWRPYYDTGFYEIWLNTNTLPIRNNFTDYFVKGWYKPGNIRFMFDVVEWAANTSAPSDPTKLIDNLTKHLFAVLLTQEQKDYIIDNVLLPNLPRFEWTVEWNAYIAAKGTIYETTKRNLVKAKLDSLFVYFARMAEFQLL